MAAGGPRLRGWGGDRGAVTARGDLDGANDVVTWETFAGSVLRRGLCATYAADRTFNHPSLMGLMAAGIAQLSAGLGLRFAFWFRVPGILADAGTTLMLFLIRRRRDAPVRAAAVAALHAWNPCSLALSGYHGNTDCIYPLFVLLSAWFAGDGGRPLAAGLALGAALNVKLIPGVLLPPLFLSLGSRRERLRFTAGFSAALLPFALAFLTAGAPFLRNVLAYNPPFDNWGLPYFLGEAIRRGVLEDWAMAASKV